MLLPVSLARSVIAMAAPVPGMRTLCAISQLCSPGYAVNNPSSIPFRICSNGPDSAFEKRFSSQTSFMSSRVEMKSLSTPPRLSLKIGPICRRVSGMLHWLIGRDSIPYVSANRERLAVPSVASRSLRLPIRGNPGGPGTGTGTDIVNWARRKPGEDEEVEEMGRIDRRRQRRIYLSLYKYQTAGGYENRKSRLKDPCSENTRFKTQGSRLRSSPWLNAC